MLETLLITFREGLEAFLIIAITLAYLAKTGRQHLAPAVYAGVLAAILISATTGYHIQELAEDPLMEGGLALAAGVLVGSMTIYVMKTAKNIRQSITTKIDEHAAKTTPWALIGLFIFTVLMIAREGMETAMMLGTISAETNASDLFLGAALGLGLTAFIGYLWVKQSHAINLKLFLQVTGVFLILFSVHLFLYGIHELTEMGAIPFVDNFALHTATEFLDGDQLIGQLITYSLLAVPCLWIAASYVKTYLAKSQLQAAE